jgi:16S rRNA (cytosine967-C5)-methyltransferase
MTRGSGGAGTVRTRSVEVLREVLERGARAAPLVGERGTGLGEADRGLLRELVLGVLRWKDALDAEIAGVSRVPLPRLAPNLREILEVALYQIRHLDRVPDYAAVSEAVSHARSSGGEGAARLANGVLRGILLLPAPSVPPPLPPGEGRGEGRTEAAAVLARYYSHPRFLVERWLGRFGEDRTRRILEADNRPPRLDLMANSRRTDRGSLSAALLAEGIRTETSALAPLALTVVSGNPIRSPLFAAGHFFVQDVGSQALPLLLPAGETLLDLAAAPGGKSFSAIAHGRCRQSVALDLAFPRLRLLEENRRRLGIPEARPVAADIARLPFSPGRFERVLLDAPCSGTGTLRKNPESRYRLTPEAVERLARAQESFLVAAAGLLAPGGYLLYSTCSLEEEENDRVVARVLEREPELSPAPIEGTEGLAPFVDGARLRLFPDERTDGFTAHLLRRR